MPSEQIIRLSSFLGVSPRGIAVPTDKPVCNPSIAADGDGFRALLRSVNYRYRPDFRLHEFPKDGFRSGTWIAEFDRGLNVTGVREIDDRAFRTGSAERGFEDPRLFRWRGEWWFSASVLVEMAPPRTLMALCRLEGDRIVECRFIRSPVGQPFEKNWMPLVSGGDLMWVHRIAPMQVVRGLNGEEPVFDVVSRDPHRYEDWSGSSQCVPYNGRWLCVIHRREVMPGQIRYRHAFVEFSGDFSITRVSEPWMFERPTIEFCAGLCLTGTSAILSYGVLDCEGRVVELPLRLVERMLRGDRRSRWQIAVHQRIGMLLGS